MINICLIGCSGNIGLQAAEIVRRFPDRFRFSALVAGRNGETLAKLAQEFQPDFAAVAEGDCPDLPQGTRRLRKAEILNHCFDGCDVALIAASGFAGLAYTLRAAEHGIKIALANKESLVCGGELVMREVEKRNVDLVPVDSEHSALFQALMFRRDTPFHRLVLTASGGPFKNYTKEQLACVTAKDALNHPTWNMGAKITVDSATLLNKGYEVIEAKWLYNTSFEKIEAIVHPESIVHSLVYFEDGAALAQLGYPDMRVPIQLALTYPERLPCAPQLDLTELGTLHFERLKTENFPCFTLALQAGKTGGTAPTILNGAGEEAVRAFLNGSIPFIKIAETIEESLDCVPVKKADSYEALQEADAFARRKASELIYGK